MYLESAPPWRGYLCFALFPPMYPSTKASDVRIFSCVRSYYFGLTLSALRPRSAVNAKTNKKITLHSRRYKTYDEQTGTQNIIAKQTNKELAHHEKNGTLTTKTTTISTKNKGSQSVRMAHGIIPRRHDSHAGNRAFFPPYLSALAVHLQLHLASHPFDHLRG